MGERENGRVGEWVSGRMGDSTNGGTETRRRKNGMMENGNDGKPEAALKLLTQLAFNRIENIAVQ